MNFNANGAFLNMNGLHSHPEKKENSIHN